MDPATLRPGQVFRILQPIRRMVVDRLASSGSCREEAEPIPEGVLIQIWPFFGNNGVVSISISFGTEQTEWQTDGAGYDNEISLWELQQNCEAVNVE